MNLAFVGMAAALGLSAAGSAFGAGFAGMSAIGAWKKCYASGKPAPFIMIAFSGAPLTQTIYGFLLMNFIRSANVDPGMALGVGLFCGLAIGLSALFLPRRHPTRSGLPARARRTISSSSVSLRRSHCSPSSSAFCC